MKNSKQEENEQYDSWWTRKRAALCGLLAFSGMSSDAVLAVLLGLKTDEQMRTMGEGMIAYWEKTGKMPNHNQVMMAMVSIRQTGVYSHGEFDEEDETR